MKFQKKYEMNGFISYSIKKYFYLLLNNKKMKLITKKMELTIRKILEYHVEVNYINIFRFHFHNNIILITTIEG